MLLVLDIGSSSVRASLWSERAEPAGEMVKLPYQRREAPGGVAEVDPMELLELTASAVDQALVGGAEVTGVATSTMWHCLLGLDAGGEPVTPVYTWADRRAVEAAAGLRDRLDEAAVHARTGCPLHSSYWPAKLAWLREAEPERFAKVAAWVSPAEHLQRVVFGDAPVSTSLASATGLFVQHPREWDSELTELLGVRETLPPIDDTPRSGLRGEWAKRWPALREVPWYPPTGDGASSNVGAGCATPDRQALMIGTSGALRVCWEADDVPVPEGLWTYRADARRVVTGGALSDGGSVIAWLRRLTRLPEAEEAEKAIAAMAPDSHGLTMVPLLSGERGPGWADGARAAITGLSLATEPIQLLRAGMEAVALRFALTDRLLDDALPGERRVIGTGGGLVASPAWTQIIADALGHPVTASAVEEASSRGAALLALEASGQIEALEAIEAPEGETFEPDPAATEVYGRALERQRSLYEATVD